MALFHKSFRHLLTVASKIVFATQSSKILTQNVQILLSVRALSSTRLTKNIRLLSNAPKKFNKFQLVEPEKKPLVVFLSWLMAKDRHIDKFASIYLDQDCDVLHISIFPWQLLWPNIGGKVIADDVLKFFDMNRKYDHVFLHGFSVAGYIWGEVMIKMVQEREKYNHILNGVTGQIWDSLTEVYELAEGVPLAMFPNNPLFQVLLRTYSRFHLHAFKNTATVHYQAASKVMHDATIRSPTLFVVSKVDPVGTEKANLVLRKEWEDYGIDVTWKCFEDSPHVLHFYKYQKEYITEMYKLLDKAGLLKYPEKLEQLIK